MQRTANRRQRRPAGTTGDSPVIHRPHQHGEQGINEGETADRDHRAVRDDGVERAGTAMRPGQHAPVLQRHGGEQHHTDRQRRRQRNHQPVGAEQSGERARPGMLFVGLGTQFGESLRQVDAEFVRRRVLAGMKAAGTVVTEIGEIAEIGVAEGASQFHRRENRTVTLAIPAGVADFEAAPDLGGTAGKVAVSYGHVVPPPRRPCGRIRRRWSCRSRPDNPDRECCRP